MRHGTMLIAATAWLLIFVVVLLILNVLTSTVDRIVPFMPWTLGGAMLLIAIGGVMNILERRAVTRAKTRSSN